ncbi:MAG: DUF1573 domain-containing protein, partial [Bacteroidales bacterium]|nr:DUF1573 domain-containing protein [Bacteroidales bacterium]
MNRTLLLIIMSLICFACKDKRIVETQRMVKEWRSKTIIFPDSITSLYVMNGHVVNNVEQSNDKDYKILFYADSAGCTSCKLQLPTWKSYIEELKDKVDFIFWLYPKNNNELFLLLLEMQFIHPVYIDRNDELNKLNHFPNNPMFQCFLLDKNDKVLAIGNPANNPKIWELYKKIITGEISDKLPITTVEPEQSEIELKDLQTGKTSETTFRLKNTGTQPLIIQMVNASCGCTVPEWEKQPIAAGKSTEIKVKITPEQSE